MSNVSTIAANIAAILVSVTPVASQIATVFANILPIVPDVPLVLYDVAMVAANIAPVSYECPCGPTLVRRPTLRLFCPHDSP